MFEEIGERNAGLGGGLRWDGSHPHYPRTRSRCFALARLVTRAERHRIDDLDPATTRAGAKARANVDDPAHSLRQTSGSSHRSGSGTPATAAGRSISHVTSRHVVPVVLYGDRPAATLAALLEFQQVQQRGPDAGAQFGICLRSAAALHRHAFGAWSRLTWQMYPVSGSRAGDDLGVQAVGGSAILHLAGEQDRWPDQVVATGSQQNLTSDALYGDRQPR